MVLGLEHKKLPRQESDYQRCIIPHRNIKMRKHTMKFDHVLIDNGRHPSVTDI